MKAFSQQIEQQIFYYKMSDNFESIYCYVMEYQLKF